MKFYRLRKAPRWNPFLTAFVGCTFARAYGHAPYYEYGTKKKRTPYFLQCPGCVADFEDAVRSLPEDEVPRPVWFAFADVQRVRG